MTLRKTIAIAAAATKIRQQIATYGVSTVAAAPPVEMRWVSLSPIPVSTTSQTTPTIDPQAGTARSTSGAQAYGDNVTLTSATQGNDVDLYPDIVKKWGLSFLINTAKTSEGRSAGSLAWAGLANTYFWIDPARNVAGVILMQLLPFFDGKALEAFAGFERGVYAGLDAGSGQRAA